MAKHSPPPLLYLSENWLLFIYLFIKPPTSEVNMLHRNKRITDKKYHSICIKNGSKTKLKYARWIFFLKSHLYTASLAMRLPPRL